MAVIPGPLGSFLKAHRELIDPDIAGVQVTGRRQVRGLRREEVAVRAGLSIDYYTRLEQGRDRNPSPQTLTALTEALLLDDDSAAYLRALVTPSPSDAVDVERVPPGIAQLIRSRTDTPAILLGRYLDVVVGNEIAHALTGCFSPGRNLLVDAFTDPELRKLYGDYWPLLCAGLVAGLRTAAGGDLDDPRLVALVAEVSMCSEEFRELWVRQSITPHTRGRVVLTHPAVGQLLLDYEAVRPASSGVARQVLVIFSAEPESPSAKALAELRTIR